MKEIPLQLKNEHYRFCKLNPWDLKKKKAACEPNWATTGNYHWRNLEEEFNYGVVGGFGDLVIIDFDDSIFQSMMLKKLPPTFTVKTAGRGLYHLYFRVDKMFRKFPIKMTLDDGPVTFADVQCEGSQVVMPWTEFDGRKYEIVHDIPITDIKTEKLIELFGKWWRPQEKKKELKHIPNKATYKGHYDCFDVMRKLGYTSYIKKSSTGYEYADPVYGVSKGNTHNFGILSSGKGWYSFHSEQGGDAVDLVAYIKSISRDDAYELIVAWRRKEK